MVGASLNTKQLGSVFKSRPDILEGIYEAADSPARIGLFNSIASYVHEQYIDPSSSEPASKRRRVDIQPSQNGKPPSGSSDTPSNTVATAEEIAAEDVLLEVKEISISIPQRKKLDIVFTKRHLYLKAPNTSTPLPGAIYAWTDIDYAFYLTVPEKSQLQYNYVLLPRGTYLPSKNPAEADPLLFTVPATAPKPGVVGGPNAAAAAAVSDSYTTLFHWALNKCLKSNSGSRASPVQVESADPSKFKSMTKQPHRPKEPAVHVKAFRGSKDGYLFFLESGILWGFKKPLMFLPLAQIASLSYTSVLQRTFNIVVEVFAKKGGEGEEGEETTEIEFSMLDQEDYTGINEMYVMRHGLQDRSLADQRKAKLELAENKKAAEAAGGDAAAGGDDTELQKAQTEVSQLLQLQEDDDDEDEEDYDPGSEGESEGSGTSSDDDDDDDDDDGGEEMDEDDDDE